MQDVVIESIAQSLCKWLACASCLVMLVVSRSVHNYQLGLGLLVAKGSAL